MAPNSLAPAFIRIDYTSKYAPHQMIIPSVPLNAVGVVGTPPNFDLRGAEIDVSTDTGVTDFVNVIKPYFPTTTKFNTYTAFTQDGAGGVPVPVWSKALNIVGTDSGSDIEKATQRTWTFRADDFTLFKMVHLDVKMGGEFDKVTDPTEDALAADVIDYVTALETWIASRGGGRPSVFLQYSETLNEKLRRSYKMT